MELHDKIRPGSPTAVPCDICISSWPWASLEPLAPRRRHNTARDRPRSSSCGGTSSALDEIPLGPWELVPHFHTRLECLGTMGDFEDLRKMMIYELNRYRIPDINKYKYMHKYAIPCLKYSMTQSIGTYWNQVLPHAIYYQWVQWCPMMGLWWCVHSAKDDWPPQDWRVSSRFHIFLGHECPFSRGPQPALNWGLHNLFVVFL